MYPLFFVIINFPPYVNELLTQIRFLYLLSYNKICTVQHSLGIKNSNLCFYY